MSDDILIFFSLEKRECSKLCLSTILSRSFKKFFFTDLSGFPETESESQSETET